MALDAVVIGLPAGKRAQGIETVMHRTLVRLAVVLAALAALTPVGLSPHRVSAVVGEGGLDVISGGDGNDGLGGGRGDNARIGDAGNSTIAGNDGNDQLSGGEGNDGLDGAGGSDKLTGGNDLPSAGGGGVTGRGNLCWPTRRYR